MVNEKKNLIKFFAVLLLCVVCFIAGLCFSFKREADKYTELNKKYETSIQQSDIRFRELKELEGREREELDTITRNYNELKQNYTRQGVIVERLTEGNKETGRLLSDIEQQISEIIESK